MDRDYRPPADSEQRQYGCFWRGLAVSVVLGVVLGTVGVALWQGIASGPVLLGGLLLAFLVVGAAAMLFIEWERRRARMRRDQGAQDWIQRTLSDPAMRTSTPPSSQQSSWTKKATLPSYSVVPSRDSR